MYSLSARIWINRLSDNVLSDGTLSQNRSSQVDRSTLFDELSLVISWGFYILSGFGDEQ